MSGRTTIAGLVLLLAACSGGDSEPSRADEPAGADASAPTTAAMADTEQPADSTIAPATTQPVGGADSGDAEPVVTEPPTTTTTVPPPAIDVGRTVVQTTPTSGNPATPTLAWEAVEGAASYTVMVADAEGSTWWTWEGAELEVALGGVASGAAALQTEAGVTWTVFAHGDDGGLLAASPRRPLDP